MTLVDTMSDFKLEGIDVIILAGGKGTRLHPYTTAIPKPLMPLGNMPILEILLRQLKSQGASKIIISVNHLASLIQNFFGNGSNLDLSISYCIESKPLGTAGSISLIEELSDPFLVINGDLLTTLSISKLLSHHRKTNAVATVAVSKREVKIDYGVINTGLGSTVKSITEKPKIDYLVSMGINLFSSHVLQYINYNEYLDIPDLIKNLLHSNQKIESFYDAECRWLDIGRPDDYEKAVIEFENNSKKYLEDL